MSREYRNEVDEKNNVKINELINSMPEFIEDYYDSLVVNGSSTNTIKSYLYEVNVFLRFRLVIVTKLVITTNSFGIIIKAKNKVNTISFPLKSNLAKPNAARIDTIIISAVVNTANIVVFKKYLDSLTVVNAIT